LKGRDWRAWAKGAFGQPAVQWAGMVFLGSLLIRVAWVASAHATPISDFQIYDDNAVRWLKTGHFGVLGSYAYRTPGYPGLLALVYALAGHSWRAAGYAQALLGALTSGLVVLVAARMLSPRASALAGALHALSPTAIAYVPLLASETQAAFLLVAALYAVGFAQDRTVERRHGPVAAAGALIGLLILVRPAAVFFLPGFLLYAAYDNRRRAWYIAPCATLVFATGFVLMPWLLRNSFLGFSPTTISTTGGVNLWMGNNDLAKLGGFCEAAAWPSGQMGEAEEDAAYAKAARSWILTHPGRYLQLSAIRASRLLGTEPDTWAAKYLRPTRANDQLFVAAFRQAWEKADPAGQEIISRAGYLESLNAEWLRKLRMITVPLVLLSLLVCLGRWRHFALVLLPLASYLGGLSATYVEVRFRELADPLLCIPVAALIAIFVFRNAELSVSAPAPSRAVAAVLGLMQALSRRARTGFLSSRAQELRAEAEANAQAGEQAAGGLRFTTLAVIEEGGRARAVWSYPTWSVSLSRDDTGLKCDVQASDEPKAEQWGGLALSVEAPRALRLEMRFLEPRNLRALAVEGYDASGTRRLAWRWEVEAAHLPSKGRLPYLLVPGVASWHFLPEGPVEPGAVCEVRVLLSLRANSKAGLVLRTVEVGTEAEAQAGDA
jgi:4-amino-4-deoxy-L-arabinose transferase-like glycosyltransferase